MRKTKCKILHLTVLSIFLMLLFSCGQKVVPINIGSDGYGSIRLDNGVKVLVNRDETTSLTSARILIGGGILSETAETNGLTNLMIKMLLKGNAEKTAEQISSRLDFLGANVSANCFRDFSAISITSLTENFDEVLQIITTSLVSPTFPEEELTKLKVAVEGDIKASNDNQSAASSKLFWKTIYGDSYYGLPTTGTVESIASATVEGIRKHFQNYVGGKNIIFSVATDLPAGQISNIVQNRLSSIKPQAMIISAPKLSLQSERTGFISYDRNQSFIFMGFKLDHLSADEVPYVVLLNEVMGNNVGSRLWYLRQKEKLAYSVYTQYVTDKFGALFRAGIGTDTSKVKIAINSLEREWIKLYDKGITAEELTDAKINMKNNLIYRIDRKGGRANYMAYYDYIGYNHRFVLDLIDKADGITLEKINQFVKDKLTEDKKYVSIVGKQ